MPQLYGCLQTGLLFGLRIVLIYLQCGVVEAKISEVKILHMWGFIFIYKYALKVE